MTTILDRAGQYLRNQTLAPGFRVGDKDKAKEIDNTDSFIYHTGKVLHVPQGVSDMWILEVNTLVFKGKLALV